VLLKDGLVDGIDVAARDHAEAHNLLSTPHGDTLAAGVTDGSIVIGNVTPAWSELVISIPAANVRNVLGIDNGELRPSWKTALDATNPAAIGSVGPGTSLVFAHRDHIHAADAAAVTYTPAVAGDWDGDADPGDVDDALDQLAERTDDLETVTLWWHPWSDWQATTTGNADFPLMQAGTTQNLRISGAIPEDWVSTVECLLVLWTNTTETLQADFSISSLAVGEAILDNQAINLNETLAVTANRITEWDITSLLPTIAAGDYIGIEVGSDTDHIICIGIRFRYLRT
jgi:hypothetical protein